MNIMVVHEWLLVGGEAARDGGIHGWVRIIRTTPADERMRLHSLLHSRTVRLSPMGNHIVPAPRGPDMETLSGTVLTGRYYVDEDRPSYQQEKRQIGEIPEEPLAERYFDDDYEWERVYDTFLDKHK